MSNPSETSNALQLDRTPSNIEPRNDVSNQAQEKILSPFYGFYWFFFGVLEPAAALAGAGIAFVTPSSFYHDLVPAPGTKPLRINHRAQLAIWQLGNCYFLLSLISFYLCHVIPKALPRNPVAQERIWGSLLTVLAIADVTHVLSTLVALPTQIVLSPSKWNGVTHGNITVTTILFCVRMAWFAGVFRTSYYHKTAEAGKAKTA